jgi:NitT/TauT family transport system ATP-binding protein
MCIAGLTRPSEGTIHLSGRELLGPPPDLVLVFQEFNKSLFAWRTVLGNVLFGLEARPGANRGGHRSKLGERARHFIKLVGLEGFENHYPWELSGGMQQRVAIARALAHEPQVLLMDEPFGSVDALTRLELEDTLLRLWEELKTTILFVTHDIEEAIYLSDVIYILSARPCQILGQIELKLKRPRNQLTTREESLFIEYRHEIYEMISRETANARAQAQVRQSEIK